MVEAGPNASRVQSPIHEGLLCHHSSFFRAAIKGGFNNDERIIRLDLKDPKVFDAFKLWLYSGNLLTSTFKPSTDQGGPYHDFLVDIWIFADYHGIPVLKSTVTDATIDRACEVRRYCTWVVQEKPGSITMHGPKSLLRSHNCSKFETPDLGHLPPLTQPYFPRAFQISGST